MMESGTNRLVIVGETGQAAVEVAKRLVEEDLTSHCASSIAVGPSDALAGLVEIAVDDQRVRDLDELLGEILDHERDVVLDVRGRRITSYERTWELGTPTPGDRLVGIVHRVASLTREEFDGYWRDVHAPIAMSFTIGFWGYTQYVTRSKLFGQGAEPDGIVIMHFRSAEERQARWAQHPEEAQRGFDDAARFMQVGTTPAVVMTETIWR